MHIKLFALSSLLAVQATCWSSEFGTLFGDIRIDVTTKAQLVEILSAKKCRFYKSEHIYTRRPGVAIFDPFCLFKRDNVFQSAAFYLDSNNVVESFATAPVFGNLKWNLLKKLGPPLAVKTGKGYVENAWSYKGLRITYTTYSKEEYPGYGTLLIRSDTTPLEKSIDKAIEQMLP